MDALQVYSTKPGSSAPNPDTWFNNNWTRAALSTSPVIYGIFIGAGTGYFQGQSWELAAAGALAGAAIILPGAYQAYKLSLIPTQVELELGERNTPRVKKLVAEREKELREMYNLSNRAKHVAFATLTITAAYYLLPEGLTHGAFELISAPILALSENMKNYASFPAKGPGLEELTKMTIRAVLFLSKTSVLLTKNGAACLGFIDFQKFVGSSACIAASYLGYRRLEKFPSMKPLTKYIDDVSKKPSDFFKLLSFVGSAALMHRFGEYLKALPKAEGGPYNPLWAGYSTIVKIVNISSIFKNWDTVFSVDPNYSFQERFSAYFKGWQQFFLGAQTNTTSIKTSNWWQDTVMKPLLDASSLPKAGPKLTETMKSPVSLMQNFWSYSETALPSFLKQGALLLIGVSVATHIYYRLKFPMTLDLPQNPKRSMGTQDLLRICFNMQTSINTPPPSDIAEYFPGFKRNILDPAFNLLQQAIALKNQAQINATHGQIMTAISNHVRMLKNNFTANNPEPDAMKNFEHKTDLVRALKLKLRELNYRSEIPAHPANFTNQRQSLVRIAKAQALQEIIQIHDEQIVLVKELKNTLENTLNPLATNIATLQAYIDNLEQEKYKNKLTYDGILRELGGNFPNVRNWEQALNGIADGNQLVFAYFEDVPLTWADTARSLITPLAPNVNATAWLTTLVPAIADEFRKNPMKTLPKLTTVERAGLRALVLVDINSLGLRKIDLHPQLFGGAPAADVVAELTALMTPN